MEATPEQTAEGLAVVQVLAAVLDRLVLANTPIARADPGQVTKFHAMKAPGIGILQYLERIHKYASCSNECFILALIYIDKLIQRNNFLLTELNVHRVVITAVLLAAKFFDDAYYNNAYYAKVGGVLVSEMNGLEVEFLFRINFSLHVTPEVFEKYRAELLSQASTAFAMQQTPLPSLSPSYLTPTLTNPVNPQQPLCSPPPTLAVSQPPPHIMKAPAAPHITPSPPPEAAQMRNDPQHGLVDQVSDMTKAFPTQYSEDGFYFPVQRASSLPEILPAPTTTGCYGGALPLAPRTCSQPSFSAPAVIAVAGAAIRYPYPLGAATNRSASAGDDRFMVMEHQIFPLQGNLVHHHHGEYAPQSKGTPEPRLHPQQMLAGAGP